MAKLTALQMVNKVLNNLGEQDVASLSSLSGLSYMVFNTINEVLYDIAAEYKLKPLEASGTITLATSTSTYALPSDYQSIDKDSLRYNDAATVVYKTPQDFDRGLTKAATSGEPKAVYEWGGVFNVWPIPNANANTKTILYRYWKIPTLYSTATETGTSYMPEGFDLTLLANLVTYKILHYKHNEEAAIYYTKVYGNRQSGEEGSLNKFKNLYGSPDIIDDNIMAEPMENSNGSKSMFNVNPITG